MCVCVCVCVYCGGGTYDVSRVGVDAGGGVVLVHRAGAVLVEQSLGGQELELG